MPGMEEAELLITTIIISVQLAGGSGSLQRISPEDVGKFLLIH